MGEDSEGCAGLEASSRRSFGRTQVIARALRPVRCRFGQPGTRVCPAKVQISCLPLFPPINP